MEQHRDVVLAAARVREIDERAGRDAHVLAATDRRGDLLGRDVTRETVAAQQETVLRAKALDEDVGLDAARIAGEPRDRVLHVARVVFRELP